MISDRLNIPDHNAESALKLSTLNAMSAAFAEPERTTTALLVNLVTGRIEPICEPPKETTK